MLATRARLLIATLWVGSLWTIGYLVAPTLFSMLSDRVLAGTIAGKLFQIEAWLSVLSGITLMVLISFSSDQNRNASKRLIWLVVAMLACTLIGYFSVHPFMAALREAAGPGGVMDSGARTQFGILHGVSSAFYLIQSLLGVVLILRVR